MPLIFPPPPNAIRGEIPQGHDETSGYVPNSESALRWRPAIHNASLHLFYAIMETHSRVTPELKMLLGHVVSGAAGCRFCQAHSAYYAEEGTFAGDLGGADPARITHVWEFRTSPLFTDAERAVLELAVGAGVTPNAVTAEMQAEARKYWDDCELVEIVAIIAFYGFTNRWHDTVATPLQAAPRAYASERLRSHGWELGKHT